MIILPNTTSKIGVFISGGLDSALMYYLVLEANKNLNHEIIPYTIARTEGSKYFARPVIALVHKHIGIPYKEPMVVGDPTLPGHLHVMSGGWSAKQAGCDQIYIGVIKQLPEHDEGPHDFSKFQDNVVKMPLANFNKIQVLELIVKNGLEGLFHITHSCSTQEVGRCWNKCKGCEERSWAFSSLGITDPGVV
jgi:Queuosine biosynthesis protein QueC